MQNKIWLTVLFLIIANITIGQNGNIRGKVYDAKLGDVVIGANVAVLPKSMGKGASTDFDGNFTISIAPGTYDLQVSFISYQTKTLNGIVVKSGETTVLDDIMLSDVAIEKGEVKIVVKRKTDNANAMIAMQRHSPNVINGISAGELKKMGGGNVASSMKRVSGISVQGGKYVYVRGLGDRYTKTLLNGLEIPGLDPDRNTIQMDLFPTSIVDNIIVHKSFSADLPADFTGGIVDIAIKDFPDKKMGSVSASLGYNPAFHFQSDYRTYEGGKLDFLGFDDGSREIPATENIPFYVRVFSNPNSDDGQRYQEVLNSFNPVMGSYEATSLLDYSFGISMGNQINNQEKKRSFGYYYAISYKNETEYYADAEYGRYGKNGTPSVFEPDLREYQIGSFGIRNIMISSLAGIALKNEKSKYRLNLLHLQNGESKAGLFDFEGSDQGSDFVSIQHNLEYNQRSLSNLLIEGKHSFTNKDWSLVWKASPTYSRVYDPDIRFTRYEIRNGNHIIGTEVGFPERIWRDLNEVNASGLVDLTKKYEFKGRKSKLRFGGTYTFKHRDYIIRQFQMVVRDLNLTGDPSELFAEENLWPNAATLNQGVSYESFFYPRNANKFDASVHKSGAYVSTEIGLLESLNAVIGVRAESFTQFYTGENQLGDKKLDNEQVLNDLDLFPALNFIFSLNEVMNLRMSYSKTIARPSFKELSYAEIYDPLTGRMFMGGFHADEDKGIVYWDGQLTSTRIHNVDLRWEILEFSGQMVSLSGFYKKFIDPIEIVQYAILPGAFQPRNVGDGLVYGAEFELRQNLGRISESLSKYSFITNVSYIQSRIELSQIEYDSRVLSARTGQKVEKYRDMAGQAPYLINAGLSYDGAKDAKIRNLEAGLYYNVQGPTLLYAGIADRPDIYVQPFHSLNFNSSFSFGKEDKMKAGFKVDNILNDVKEEAFDFYNNSSPAYFTRLYQGVTFSASFTYNLF